MIKEFVLLLKEILKSILAYITNYLIQFKILKKIVKFFLDHHPQLKLKLKNVAHAEVPKFRYKVFQNVAQFFLKIRPESKFLEQNYWLGNNLTLRSKAIYSDIKIAIKKSKRRK